jgi:DHA1 family bicyclomycin/chloramphenicol resistance-like MFS transporter
LQKANVSAPALAITLAGLAMLGPFSIDTYLPSFPEIQREFAASPFELQQTLSVYIITFAVMTLFHGALSDSFGRRPVILVSLALYVLASIGCAFAGSFGQVLFFRAMQGLCAGVGWVVGRAIVRDAFNDHEAQRLLSLITMIFGIAPAVAPVIGGWLQGAFGWRSVFVFLSLYGVLQLALCWWRLPETHPKEARQPFAAGPLFRNYLRLAGDPLLVLLSVSIAFNFAGMFLYVASAPAIIYGLFDLDENGFPVLFVPAIAGIMVGAFLSGRMAGRVPRLLTVRIGFIVMFCAVAFNVGYHAFHPAALPWTVLAVMLYSVGMALAGPSVQLMVLDLHPRLRGTASSLQGFTHSLFTAIAAGLISPLVAHSGFTLAAAQAALLTGGCVCWILYLRAARPVS